MRKHREAGAKTKWNRVRQFRRVQVTGENEYIEFCMSKQEASGEGRVERTSRKTKGSDIVCLNSIRFKLIDLRTGLGEKLKPRGRIFEGYYRSLGCSPTGTGT